MEILVLRSHLDKDHYISKDCMAMCKRCTLGFANQRRLLLHYQTKHDDELSLLENVMNSGTTTFSADDEGAGKITPGFYAS